MTSPEHEQAALGAVLLSPERSMQAMASRGVDSACFTTIASQKVWECMLALHQAGTPIDMRSVQAESERRRADHAIGGLAYLAGLSDQLPDLSRVGHIADRLVELRELRALRLSLGQLSSQLESGETSAATIRSQLESHLGRLQDPASRWNPPPPPGEEILKPPDRLLLTPWQDLDRALYPGIPSPEIVLLAGHTGGGKSVMAKDLSLHWSRSGLRGIIASLEMTREQYYQRMVSSEAVIPYDLVQLGQLDKVRSERARATVAELAKLPLVVDDQMHSNWKSFKLRMDQYAQHGLDYLVVDYIQEISEDHKELSEIMAHLKAWTKRHRVVVVLVSQYSRDNQRRNADPEPRLSDAKGGSALEQGSAVGILLSEEDGDGVTHCHIKKHRYGRKGGKAPLALVGEMVKFASLGG